LRRPEIIGVAFGSARECGYSRGGIGRSPDFSVWQLGSGAGEIGA